ncbi:DUF4132 domain-containing protein [Corynebacterium freiburgense]|uniref:DUF4132 domain-containing protein n=1 Tax=Corynebacterium freiburgense TaxID=556548 RepID=UPI000425D063|nr:DUF4132 domain-containing protein [Corynebacterium freiburgense]WJZ02565.1 hypothetical protein CFREI_06390 [Corynebacterium freiburgense]
MDTHTEHWIPAGDYSLKITDGKIIARNAKGRVLKTLPAKAKKTPEFEKVSALHVYLQQHEVQCLDTLRDWFIKSLPIPTKLITAVWVDPSWQKFLRDLVVSTDTGLIGLLRDASDNAIQIIDLDGETATVSIEESKLLSIPHPAILQDLEEWQEFAIELGVHQGIDQLFRDLYTKPDDEDTLKKQLAKYEGFEYEKAGALLGRSRNAGFQATLEYISLSILESGIETTIQLDVYAWYPDEEAEINGVRFLRDGDYIKPSEVGPITWSEALRMCEFIYSGRSLSNKTA